jgi:hypothetical protein
VKQIGFTDGTLRRTIAIADKRFAVEHVTIDASGGTLATGGRPLAIMAMDAPIALDIDETSTPLGRWSTAIVPASNARVAFTPADGPMDAMVVRVQPDLARLREEATTGGVAQADLDGFFAQFA